MEFKKFRFFNDNNNSDENNEETSALTINQEIISPLNNQIGLLSNFCVIKIIFLYS